MYLKDKVVIITGASRGIGRSTARLFAYEGCCVVASGRTKTELDALVKEIEAEGGRAISVVADGTKKEEVQKIVQAAIAKFGKVDILVNNAGMGIYGEVAEINEDDFDTMVGINFKGVFLATKAVLPAMIKQRSGHIITVSSVAGKRPVPKMAVYSGTKHALDGFCKSLAKEVKPHNIRMSLIYPGMVDSHFREKMTNRPKYSSEERTRMLTSDDIARAIVFLANQSPTSMIDELEINAPLF